MGYEIYKYISSAHHKSVTTDVSQQMATQNSRTAARVLAAASLLLPPLLVLATTVSLASAACPAPANTSLQSAASAPVATDVEPGNAVGKLLVTKVVSPSEAPGRTEIGVIVSPPLPCHSVDRW